MRSPLLLWALAAAPFWESKPPKDWSEEELQEMLTNSPWARAEAFLSSALPMREAEQEWRRRHIAKRLDAPEAGPDDYFAFMRDNPGRYVVVAVRVTHFNDLLDAKQIREMEKGCFLRAGKQKLKMTGHYPPSASDPYLRIVFPRPEVRGKSVKLDLYLPGVAGTFRQLEFSFKEMSYRGRLEL
jgi:hypothetical protein